MRILHVLSQFEVTGAETYAATLITEQVARGHEVIVVSDTLTTRPPAEYIPMLIGVRAFRQRLRNVAALRRLIRDRRVQVVNTHSRAGSWVAFFATRLSRVPLVSTVHSRQWVPPQSRLFSVYGERIVPVSETLSRHLVDELGLPASRVQLVRNAIDLDRFRPGPEASSIRKELGLDQETLAVVLVSRLSRGKAEVAKFFVGEVWPRVREALSDAVLVVVGGMKVPPDFQALVEETDRRVGGCSIRVLGHRPNVADYLQAADAVVGSGRVAMEAMAMMKPVVVLGESLYLGVVSDRSAPEAMASNFGDTTTGRPRDPGPVADDLVALLRDRPRREELGRWGRGFVERTYSVQVVKQEFDEVYRRARLERMGGSNIPVLMYHKVVDAPVVGSGHGTWVTRERFARQLASLQRRGFTTVTLRDCAACAKGEMELPPRPIILTFDDGYLDNHTNAVPLLRRFGMTGVIFVLPDPELTFNAWDTVQGEPRAPLLGREQILEMAEYGIEFGSHTLTHPRLTEVPEGDLRRELCASKEALESWLGSPVVSVAYPYGAVNETVKRLAREAGYQLGVATNSGPAFFGRDPFEIRRVQVLPWTDRFQFWKRSSRWYLRYKRLKHGA